MYIHSSVRASVGVTSKCRKLVVKIPHQIREINLAINVAFIRQLTRNVNILFRYFSSTHQTNLFHNNDLETFKIQSSLNNAPG